MAKEVRSKTRAKRPAPKQRPKRRRRQRKGPSLLARLIQAIDNSRPEFRPDAEGTGFLKAIRFTQLQRLQLLRWVSYIALCLLCLVVQDVIMSRITILGTTTDLAAGIILLITVMEGSEVGSVFVLIASVLYYFSGTAPGAYTVGLMTTLGIVATVFRQQMWHRSSGSIVLCSGLALLAYEIGVYGIGLFLGLTRWDRILAFLFTAVLTTLVMIPLYHLIYRLGQIGGYVWKE